MENTELKVRSEYEGKMEARLKDLGAKIDDLMAKGEAAGEAAKGQLSENVAKLKQQQAQLSKKLAETKQASADAWSELKPGLDRAWDELGKAFNEVKQASERAAGKLHK
jgi:ABC-type transporter Mla subunit MlaD